MLSAVVHLQGIVHLVATAGAEATPNTDPGPIIPELKELAWGAGSFVVLAVLMRYWLFPQLKKGMDARYHGIQDDHANAEGERAAARSEVAEYEQQLAAIKAEATARLNAARATVEGERQTRLAEVNERVGQQRAAAVAEVDAAKVAVRDQIHAAVSDVAGRAGELATGKAPDPAVVQRVVSEVMAR